MNTIAVVSYNMYAYLFLPERKVSGGAELQLAILSRKLVELGHEVVFFTGDFGQPEQELREGMRFIKLGIEGEGRLTKFRRFSNHLRALKPSCMIERGTSAFTVPAILFSKWLKIPYIFCGASDINFASNSIDPSFGKSRIKQWLYHKCLPSIAHFIVQKKGQSDLLEKNFGISRNVSVIKSFPPPSLPSFSEMTALAGKAEFDAVWVANFIPYKQPGLFIELAAQNPSNRFLMIGASADQDYDREIRRMASGLTNITLTGYLPPKEIMSWMMRSKLVVNTTSVGNGYEEGFSNVQLMGWACGLPSLTLISDPDNLIVQNNIGLRAGTFEQLCADFRRIISSDGVYDQMRMNALKYVEAFHNTHTILEQYLNVLNRYQRVKPAGTQNFK